MKGQSQGLVIGLDLQRLAIIGLDSFSVSLVKGDLSLVKGCMLHWQIVVVVVVEIGVGLQQLSVTILILKK